MRTKLIVVEVILLAGAVGVFLISGMEEERTGGEGGEQTEAQAYPNLPVQEIETVELRKGDRSIVFRKTKQAKRKEQSSQQEEEQKEQEEATQEKGMYRPDFTPDWILDSYHNYAVQEDLVQDRIIRPVRLLKRGEVRAEGKTGLDEFGLDSESAMQVTLKGSDDTVLKRVVLGRITSSFQEETGMMGGGNSDEEEKQFIYYYDDTGTKESITVRKGRMEKEFTDLSLKPKEWAYKKITDFPDEKQKKPNLIALQKQKKLYVLMRDLKEKKEDEENNGDGSRNDQSNEEPTLEFSDWTLLTGTMTGERTYFSLRQKMRLTETSLDVPGQAGGATSISLSKQNTKQSSVDSLFSTISSLEADMVRPPITKPAEGGIPEDERKKYGFGQPDTVIYLGVSQPQSDVAVFVSRFFVGKKQASEDDETYYFSSLQAQQQSGAQQLRSLFGGPKKKTAKIPVYELSSVDGDTLTKLEDLIEKEEEKKDEKGKENEGKQKGSEQNEKESETGNGSSGEQEGAKGKNESKEGESSNEKTDSSSGNGDQ